MSRNSRGLITVVCVCLAQFALSGLAAAAYTPHGTLSEEACPVARIRLNVTYACAAEFTLEGSNGYRDRGLWGPRQQGFGAAFGRDAL